MTASLRPAAGFDVDVVAGATSLGTVWQAVDVTGLAGLHGPGRFRYWLVRRDGGLHVWVVPCDTPVEVAMDAHVQVLAVTVAGELSGPVTAEQAAVWACEAHRRLHVPVPTYDEAER